MNKERYYWIDVAKFIGIFSIYLGHFGEFAGHSYLFVFKYHVPLFFFLSGCTESLNKEDSISRNILKKIKTILIPYIFFALLSIVVYVIYNNSGLKDVGEFLLLVIKGGVRNTFFAMSLWFLTCISVISIIFEILKLLKSKLLITIVCFIIYNLATWFVPSNPSWIFNFDSALWYIIYYCLGYVCFEKINQQLNKNHNVFLWASGALAFIYSALLFFGHDILLYTYNLWYINRFISIVTSLIIIWLIVIISHICKDFVVLQNIGMNSLYLCGNEFIVKLTVQAFAQIWGINLLFPNPLCVFIYVIILQLLVIHLFCPTQKKTIKQINNIFNMFRV